MSEVFRPDPAQTHGLTEPPQTLNLEFLEGLVRQLQAQLPTIPINRVVREHGTVLLFAGDGSLLATFPEELWDRSIPTIGSRQRAALNDALARDFWAAGLHNGFWA